MNTKRRWTGSKYRAPIRTPRPVDALGAAVEGSRGAVGWTLLLAGVSISLLAACSTQQVAESRNEHSHLKCLGYCDLTITDEKAEIDSKVDITELENDD